MNKITCIYCGVIMPRTKQRNWLTILYRLKNLLWLGLCNSPIPTLPMARVCEGDKHIKSGNAERPH